jgi:DNA mismatch repair protein MSH6
MAVILA